MGSNYNKRKEDQLGMAFGTACHRLRKNILLHLLQTIGENICFQCHLPIEKASELSIEHKTSWLNVSADLFWDMDNIAFSHLKCNREAAICTGSSTSFSVGNSPCPRKIGPDGTAWCSGECQGFIPVKFFAKNISRWNGLQTYCRLCRSKKRSKHSYKNLEALSRIERESFA